MADFDFQALLDNPQFAFGLSLLGGANPKNAPLLQALQMTQMMKKNKLAEEKDKQAVAMQQEHAKLYQAQVNELIRKGKSAESAAALQKDWMESTKKLLGGEQTPQMPQPQVPAPNLQQMPAPGGQQPVVPMPNMGVLTPNPSAQQSAVWLKPEWEQKWLGAEFGNNQAPQDPALAEHNKRIGYAYLNKQFEDFKGNPAHAFAAYSSDPGAVRKALAVADKAGRPDIWLSLLPAETRQYVAGILGPQQPAVTEEQKQKMFPPSSPLGLRNPGLPLAVHAATGAAMGIKGAKEFIDVAKMLEPKSVAAGSYQQDAQGNLAFIPNPDKQEELKLQRERLEMDKLMKDVQAGKITQEQAQDKGKAFQAIENVDASMERLSKTAAQLKDHPGLKMITGMTGGLINPRLLGPDARNAAAILDTLKAQAFTNATLALRQASPTGAGVGNQSDAEGNKLTDSMARLNQAQTLKEFQAALKDVQDLAEGARSRMRKAYEIGYEGGKSTAPKAEPIPPGAKQIGTSKGKPVYETPDGKRFVVQ